MKTYRILLLISFIAVLIFSSFNKSEDINSKKFVVVLDAGHGGHDPGNLGNGYKEKDIALKIVFEIGRQLEKDPNIKVVYTRKKDVFIDLFVRGQIANKANADLFVSVHCNAHNSQAHGTETFVLGTHRNKTNFEVAKKENSVIFMEEGYKKNYAGFDPNSPESFMSILLSQEEYLDQSIMLASLIQKRFTNSLKRKNRGVKQAGFIVLHQTVMPSVLVETGFLSYKKEGAYLNSKKGRLEISTSIANAIFDYKKNIFKDTAVYKEDLTENKPSYKKEEKESEIVFKVQIAASSKNIATKSYNFKGLKNISKIKEGYLYKYFYSNSTSFEEAKKLKEQAKEQGYRSSFIVAFKDGKKIALAKALKTTVN